MISHISPPSPDFHGQYKRSTLEELQARFGGTPVQDAAKKAAETFERVRPKMDTYRDLKELRSMVWKLQ